MVFFAEAIRFGSLEHHGLYWGLIISANRMSGINVFVVPMSAMMSGVLQPLAEESTRSKAYGQGVSTVV